MQIGGIYFNGMHHKKCGIGALDFYRPHAFCMVIEQFQWLKVIMVYDLTVKFRDVRQRMIIITSVYLVRFSVHLYVNGFDLSGRIEGCDDRDTLKIILS